MYIQKQLTPPPPIKAQHILIIWPLYNSMTAMQFGRLEPIFIKISAASFFRAHDGSSMDAADPSETVVIYRRK